MKKILYTGATSGIAKEVIKKLKNKYYIYIGTHTEKQKQLLKQRYIQEKNIEVIKLDLLNKKDLEKIKKIDIDILISNAAISYGGSISEIELEKVREIFEINVFKNFELVQIVLEKMIKKNQGKIIMISSLAALMPMKFIGPYSASKASINKLTIALKKELKLINKNIHISIIEPGMYKTGFNQIMLENKYDWMEKKSYFKKELETIRKKESILWNILEKRKLKSITKQIVKAVETNNKFIYSAPLTQRIIAKIHIMINE